MSGISFSVRRGETLARLLAGLYKPTAESIDFEGFVEKSSGSPDFERDIAGRLNMIFQDPYASLNPRMRIADIIAEPLETLHPDWTKDAVEKRVRESAELVRLPDPRLRSSRISSRAGSARESRLRERSPLGPSSSSATNRPQRLTSRCRRRS